MNTNTTTDIQAAVRSTGLDVLLLAEYGSRAYGTATEASDRDLLGIYLEHDRQLYGLEMAETKGYRIHGDGEIELMGRSAKEFRSGADVVEMHFHPLRKYVSLAAKGNPTVLSAMWATGALAHVGSPAGDLLTAHRDGFLSKHAGYRHAGYARSQREALLGLTNKRTNRQELVRIHSYDTKYAMHMVRVLLAGLDLVRERNFHLPMKPEQVKLLREIRGGEVELEDLLTLSEKLEHDLTTETEDSNLPDSVDYDAINDLLRLIRNEHLGR